MERMAMESFITTGRFSMAPRPRMPTLGWLITGSPNRPPKTPGLVMEKVLSCTSSGFIFFDRVFHYRHEQAPVERHGDPDVDLLVQDYVGPVERGVQCRIRAQPSDGSFHEEGHEGQLGLVALLEFILGLGT